MNIRVPLKLIKTGIKLSTVLPSETNAKLADKGIDLSNLGDLQGEELIEALRDLQVDLDAGAAGGEERVRDASIILASARAWPWKARSVIRPGSAWTRMKEVAVRGSLFVCPKWFGA